MKNFMNTLSFVAAMIVGCLSTCQLNAGETYNVSAEVFLNDKHHIIGFYLDNLTKDEDLIKVDLIRHGDSSSVDSLNILVRRNGLRSWIETSVFLHVIKKPKKDEGYGWRVPMSLESYGSYVLNFYSGDRRIATCLFHYGEQAGLEFVKISKLKEAPLAGSLEN